MAVDIKQICDYSDKLRNVSYILTETVGTTTSYTFPEDTLIPYIKRNVKEYIINHWDDEEIKKMVEALKKQAKVEMEEGWVGAVSIPEGDGVDINAVKDAVAAYALNQIESSDLELLQNLIVKDGYSKGQLKGHLFSDVLPAFKKWTADGKKIYMYSSGLELSQNCLISNSIEGDITELISGCFNSSEFPRTKSESFREMCKKVDCAADKVAFLTDNAPTARAARKAGLVVIMLCREGNSYMGNCVRESFPVITSFEDISQQICSKRKKSSDETESTAGNSGKKAKLEDNPAKPDAKVEENKCEETVTKDVVPSDEPEPKKDGKKSESSEDKVKVEDEKVAPKGEDEEKMEVEEAKVEKVEKKTAEDSTDVKIVITPPDEEKVTAVEAGAKEMKVVEGGTKEKVEKEQEKEGGAEEVEKAEKKEVVEKTVSEAEVKEDAKMNEESSKSKEEESKETGEKTEESAEPKAEEKESKVGAPEEKTKEEKEQPKAEEKAAEEEPSTKKEREDEKKMTVTEDVSTVENGDAVPEKESASSDDAVTENGEAEKEVRSNGVDHENGEGKENGVSSDEKVESPEKEAAVKAVPKKPELEESVTDATAAQKSA